MIHLKVKLVWQDTGFCVNFYKVVNEGKNKNAIICAIDILEKNQKPVNWYTCGGEVEGEPGFPIDEKKFSIEAVEDLTKEEIADIMENSSQAERLP